MKQTERQNSFLGRGWSFPPKFVKGEAGTAGLRMSADEQDIQESIAILLSTRLGERIMLPGYGCDLTTMLFEGLSASVVTYIKDMVRTALKRHEPRIKLEKTNIRTEKAGEGLVLIEVNYLVRATNTRTNFVYPYYINEATNL
jgi:phage baseplate assembly protein W